MRGASLRSLPRDESGFSPQLIKGVMVVEYRLCCPWLLMSCLQAANEDRVQFCCSRATSLGNRRPAERWSSYRPCLCQYDSVHNGVLCIWRTKKTIFRCLFCSHYTERNGRQKHVCYKHQNNEIRSICFSLGFNRKHFGIK